MCNEAVFMEPGKDVFQLIDVRNSRSKNPFMGELAELNSELMMLKPIQYFDYNKMQDTILKINPEEYKKFCFDIRDRELEELGKKAQTGNFSAKALQVKKIDIEYQAMVNAMSYNMNFESSYRKKNKIPRQERELGIEIPKPDTTYYSFLSNSLVNNELALIAPSYKNFINRLKYLDLLRDKQERFNFAKPLEYLIAQKEIEPTEEEVLVINQMQALEQMINQEEWIRFFKNNIAGIQAFHKKHNELIDKMAKEDDFSLWHDIERILHDNGIELLSEEKAILDTAQKIIPREAVQAQQRFFKTHGEAQKAMQIKYSKQINQYMRNYQSVKKEKLLRENFGIEKGLATNLFASQDICRGIVEETTPLDNDELLKVLKPVQIPFIAEYIKASNKATKEKLEKNKEITGYYVNQTPSVESEKLFDALMAKFKGKVVLVDFWATWCAPCRSGIERIKPLKEEMAGKNVVFVYITNDSSPQKTWENMIPDIKGEHFKLTRDEWNALSARFNISGIPHYVLVDKNGEVANNNTLNTQNQRVLKALLEEFLQK
jgi:thiol-disulfide isomerase/thioredoxin